MNKNLNLKKSTALASMLLFALIISACGPTATNTTKPNTASNTSNANTTVALACDDDQIRKDIIATIELKYPLLKSRMNHLNASPKDCSVSLMGYTDTLENFKDFYKVAAGAPNVVKVNIDRLVIERSDASLPDPRCPPDEEPCGDICVPKGTCWIKMNKPDTNTNSNTNTNANSVSNSNSNSKSNSKP